MLLKYIRCVHRFYPHLTSPSKGEAPAPKGTPFEPGGGTLVAMAAPSSRPLPVPDDLTRPYWQAAWEGRLELPRCAACGRWRFPPIATCDACGSPAFAWTPVSGQGNVYSFGVIHENFIKGFDPPYVVAQIELAEQPGLCIMANILDCPPRRVAIGMAVSVTFEQVSDTIRLPQFRPVG